MSTRTNTVLRNLGIRPRWSLPLALTLGLAPGELLERAEEQRISVVLELLVPSYVWRGCGLGRGELTQQCLLIRCLYSTFGLLLLQKPAD